MVLPWDDWKAPFPPGFVWQLQDIDGCNPRGLHGKRILILLLDYGSKNGYQQSPSLCGSGQVSKLSLMWFTRLTL